MILTCDTIKIKIKQIKELTAKNQYMIEVYERVNELAGFTPRLLLLLKLYDQAKDEAQRLIALDKINYLKKEFFTLKDRLEKTYSKTRVLHKPQDYILDQDHHHHLANQTNNFDWQFAAELLMFEKIDKQLKLDHPKPKG